MKPWVGARTGGPQVNGQRGAVERQEVRAAGRMAMRVDSPPGHPRAAVGMGDRRDGINRVIQKKYIKNRDRYYRDL